MITDKIYTAIIIEIIVQGLILIAIVLGILLSRKGSAGKADSGSYGNTAGYQNFNNQNVQQQYTQPGGQVTYCKKCANEYDASLWICPYCGTPR